MKEFMWNMYFKAKALEEDFFKNEDGDVNIVSIVVLIGIVVILAIVFRKEIEKLLTTLFGKISSNASGAIETTT